MAVLLGPAVSPGTAEEATAVAAAVLAALHSDELDWIEWEGSLDLSSKAVLGILARHILGMANRMPETAATHAGGRGISGGLDVSSALSSTTMRPGARYRLPPMAV